MGREVPSPVRDAGSSSGQKRKAFTMENGGEDNVPPSWLKLSLGPVVYGDAKDTDDDSSAAVTTSPEELPRARPVLQGAMAATAQPSPIPAVDTNAVDTNDAVAPAFVASATGVLVDDGNGGALTAASVLYTGDVSGSIPVAFQVGCDGNVSVVAPCSNFLVPSGSLDNSLHHQYHQQSSSTRQPTRSARRRSNASVASSSGSGGVAAPTNTNNNGANGGGNDNDDNNGTGNFVANPPYPWATNEMAKHHSLAELRRRGITTLKGEAQCRRCDTRKMMVYNIEDKFQEVAKYFRENCLDMNDRASARWMNPTIPDCDNCGQKNSMRPKTSSGTKLVVAGARAGEDGDACAEQEEQAKLRKRSSSAPSSPPGPPA
ncbi:hypothetical protein E2562_026033 [Oryza meyeriana var. granulata]|uniref:DUF7086 domain-containing protein n=1 Tax=Oryza meyeriana var. granulata TaxID=110450 RepID=A0A6G1EPN2_9ORYZ|nr:hypothetical protein E2562_026033 [Oryza meyeriana var. granulata]